MSRNTGPQDWKVAMLLLPTSCRWCFRKDRRRRTGSRVIRTYDKRAEQLLQRHNPAYLMRGIGKAISSFPADDAMIFKLHPIDPFGYGRGG